MRRIRWRRVPSFLWVALWTLPLFVVVLTLILMILVAHGPRAAAAWWDELI